MALPIARRATRVSLPLVGAFVVGAIAYGGLYTFPVISLSFAQELGISRTLAVTPWTMFLIVTALASPLLGRAYDEFADRDLLTASMVLLAAGWLAVYLAGDISLIILAYAVFHAIGLQLAFIGISTAIARRYAGMSGLALGIAYAGPGIGVAVALPVAAQLIQTAGWRSTSLAFMASCLIGVAFVWMMTSGPPIVVPAPGARRPRTLAPAGAPSEARSSAALGEPLSAGQASLRATEARLAARASGLHETSAPGAVSAAQEIPPTGSREHRHSVRRIVRTRRFWILFAGAAAIGVFDEGVLQAFIPSAVHSGMRADAAAAALGLQALTYVAGQVVGGWLSDRIGRRIVGLLAAVIVGGLRRPDIRDDLRIAGRGLSGRRHPGRLCRSDHVRLDGVVLAPGARRARSPRRLVDLALGGGAATDAISYDRGGSGLIAPGRSEGSLRCIAAPRRVEVSSRARPRMSRAPRSTERSSTRRSRRGQSRSVGRGFRLGERSCFRASHRAARGPG